MKARSVIWASIEATRREARLLSSVALPLMALLGQGLGLELGLGSGLRLGLGLRFGFGRRCAFSAGSASGVALVVVADAICTATVEPAAATWLDGCAEHTGWFTVARCADSMVRSA